MSVRRHAAFAAAVLALSLGSRARAEGSRFGPHDVRTIFVIGKNLDKNEVQYGIRLDKDCMPVGNEPVYAYWRQFEQGPEVTEDLNMLDKTAYGIKGQWVRERAPEGSKVLVTLRATNDRGIAILTKKGDGGRCEATAIATIAGGPARLERVFVQVAGFLRVAYIEIIGHRVPSGERVVERAKP